MELINNVLANLPQSLSSVRHISFYVAALLISWVILRYSAVIIASFVKKFRERDVKVDPFVNDVKYPVSSWTERGGRPYQEDRYQAMKAKCATAQNLCSMYGVFDGHGGDKAAEYCKNHMLQTMNTDSRLEKDPKKAMYDTFFKVDAAFSGMAKVKHLTDGTTAIVAMILDNKLYVANAGDSRGVLVQKGGKVKCMSDDHRPDRPDEIARIRKLGGRVVHWGRWRVEGVLAVSRAVGDVSLQPYITCEPEIVEKEIEAEDEFMVLASDGIYDVMTNEELGKLVMSVSKDFLNMAKAICTEAILLGSTDNVTVLVIDLKRKFGAATTTTAAAASAKVFFFIIVCLVWVISLYYLLNESINTVDPVP